ncbi:MAG: cystathionine beta-lyase [Hyphomicrobium aestuarii]|nr:cystathionine beta-lyase [Hyphomicrobium aestuarii]
MTDPSADDEPISDVRTGSAGVATRIIHDHRDPGAHNGFVNAPAYRGSTVLFPTLDALTARSQPYTYGRRGNPNTVELERQIAALEGGDRTILTASGYQAVTTAILAYVAAGDEILVTDSVYQPTRHFCDTALARFGVKTTYYDPLIGAGIAQLLTPKTRLVWTESPGSQTFEVQDIPAIVAAVTSYGTTDGQHPGVIVAIDNTWASPLYFKPFAHGIDVSVQSLTKYVVGHSDALLGAVTATGRAVKPLIAAKEALGVCPGSEETWLALRGLRTLHVRLAHHQASGLALAGWLSQRPEVATVLHPGLEGAPGHELWKRDFLGASGLFTMVLQPITRAQLAAFVDHLRYFGMGYSWGGFESLIVPFEPQSYRTATVWSYPGPALRLHVGLEDIEDLKADLAAGFARIASPELASTAS